LEESARIQAALGMSKQSVIWHQVKSTPHNLYPNIPWKDGNPTRRATNSEIQLEYNKVNQFRPLTSGLNIIKEKKEVIAIVGFTPFSELNRSQIDDLNYVSNFLHASKCFINSVSSFSWVWAGLMWVVGWRKSYDENQIIGRYIKAFDAKGMIAYDEHYLKSTRVRQIIGNLFKDLAHRPFQNNQDLMKKYKIPSLESLSYGELPDKSTCTPHITYTTNGFFNPPQKDTDNISEYAFSLFLPTRTSDQSLVNSSEYDIKSGPFIFPDHKIFINFDHQHGIVK
jgi:hypothetical protein